MANTDKVRVMLRRFSIILYRMDQQHNTFITTRPIFKTHAMLIPKNFTEKGKGKNKWNLLIDLLLICQLKTCGGILTGLEGVSTFSWKIANTKVWLSIVVDVRIVISLATPMKPLSGRVFPPECVDSSYG